MVPHPPAALARRAAAASSAVALAAVLLAGCAPAPAAPAPPAPVSSGGAPAAAAPPAPPPAPPVSYPAGGGNRWDVAAGEAAPAAGQGRLLRYRVAVERDIRGVPVAGFAAEVTRILSDPQGWTAGGTWRLRRVGPGQRADFTVHLATPDTRDLLCQDDPDGYTSCRNGDRVVLNVARWVKGAPGFGTDLAHYRRYLVNHEVGHRLGMGHQLCPGRGRPAPVMQQQTLGLHGCTPNGWPYPNGRLHSGPPGAYADPIPPRDRGRPAQPPGQKSSSKPTVPVTPIW
ncbi:DUF3152 domain-containing protein [Micromonospora sp. WMMD956]|uniref:DUF3152 domain-containing protein n=1 Tax=Micromonospora sp. WMMD956 TaxID=3016108 RepID=UPI00241601CF|nr:DUF3152 domain-containing protein [Micromonospora sp. WMMD956]MDG4820017.1 DUF3152 domain-containing protein [Micromonospora sp. WMMD956]